MLLNSGLSGHLSRSQTPRDECWALPGTRCGSPTVNTIITHVCASAHVGRWFEKNTHELSTFFLYQLGGFGFFQFSRSEVRKRLYEESATDSSPALKAPAGNCLSGNPPLACPHPHPRGHTLAKSSDLTRLKRRDCVRPPFFLTLW